MINQRRRVLIVEDEPGLVTVLAELLTGEGYEIRHADNGYVALEMVTEWGPDVVLLDLTLPGIDGLEVARRLRDLPDVDAPPTPIVVVTGAHAGIEAALAVGAVAAIQKPFALDDVLEAIDRALGGFQSG